MQTSTSPIHAQLPQAVRASYEPSKILHRPFGPRPSLVPRNFVARLLDKAARNDTAYDPYVAYALSVISGWAYSDGQTLSNKLKYYGLPFNTVDEISVVNPAMLVVASAFLVRSECGRVGVLVFRGTDPADAVNWLTDCDVFMKPFTYGQVHSGFYVNLQAIWDEISAKLVDAAERREGNGGGTHVHGVRREPLEALYITGHSLGGAMAVLAAAKICMNEGPVAQWLLRGVYTYGQPAVGDLAFAEQCRAMFGRMLYRHVYGLDVVPRMPPRTCGRFVHFGEERVTTSPTEPWSKLRDESPAQCTVLTATVAVTLASWFSRRFPLASRLRFPYSIDDHSPSRYIEASRTMLVADRVL